MLTGPGMVTIRATQASNANYQAAAPASRSFQVFDPLADGEKDGINALLEYALNLNSNVNDAVVMTPATGTRGLPVVTLQNVGGQARMVAEYVRRRAASNPGIAYRFQFSSDLANAASWVPAGSGSETLTQIDAIWERVKVTDSQPANPIRYGRLVVTLP